MADHGARVWAQQQVGLRSAQNAIGVLMVLRVHVQEDGAIIVLEEKDERWHAGRNAAGACGTLYGKSRPKR